MAKARKWGSSKKARAATAAAGPSWSERALALAGDATPADVGAAIAAFRSFVLLHATVRSWLWLRLGERPDTTGFTFSAVLLTVALCVSLRTKLAHHAALIALPALVFQLVWSFPLTDNHFFIELFCVALLALAGGPSATRDDDALFALRSLRWLVAIVLFHTGLQKVLYGYYFQGEFLAFMIGLGGRFSDLFGALLPVEEIARLEGYDPMRTGAGPYRVDYLPFLVASNLVWIAELALAPLLLIARTRTMAAITAAIMVFTIQLGAREVGFAFLFVNLLVLFLPGAPGRRLLPVCAVIYLYALGAALGLLPGGSLLEAGYL